MNRANRRSRGTLRRVGIALAMAAAATAAFSFSDMRPPADSTEEVTVIDSRTPLERKYNLENTAFFEAKYPGELGMVVREVERRIAMYPRIYGTGNHGGLIADVMATRMAENGRLGREYGIMPDTLGYPEDMGVDTVDGFVPYKSETEKQIVWCVGDWQEKNRDELVPGEGTKAGYVDARLWADPSFIEEQAKEYAPVDAENDPDGLNQYWPGNVLKYMMEFSIDL